MNLFEKASASVRRLNPHLFGPVDPVEAHQPKPALAPALERRESKRPRGQDGVRCRVTLVACVRRALDDDNLTGACKPLRDAIATRLGLDDGDRRLEWTCQQIATRGQEGVIVRMELMP